MWISPFSVPSGLIESERMLFCDAGFSFDCSGSVEVCHESHYPCEGRLQCLFNKFKQVFLPSNEA